MIKPARTYRCSSTKNCGCQVTATQRRKAIPPTLKDGFALPAALLLVVILSIITLGLVNQSPLGNEIQYRRFNQTLSDELAQTGLESIATLIMMGDIDVDGDDNEFWDGTVVDMPQCSATNGFSYTSATVAETMDLHQLSFLYFMNDSEELTISSCAWSEDSKASSIAVRSVVLDVTTNEDATTSYSVKTFLPY